MTADRILGIVADPHPGPPVDEIDIYRSAKLLIDLYGSDAPIEAAMRADAMIERGDMDGAAVCKRVLRAIAEIQATAGRTKH